jgi:hypothetical protein
MLLKLSKFFLYASVFAVVVVLPSTFFPFIGGKYYFFRVAVELALASFVLWWAFDPEGTRLAPRWLKELFPSPLFGAVSAFVFIFLLATAFAYDPYAAFWSNYERGDGGFQMLHYYIFFVLLAAVFREEGDWRKLFWFSLAAATAMLAYGFLANVIVKVIAEDKVVYRNVFGFYGPYLPDIWGRKDYVPGFWDRLFNNRFQGSLGNPAYVAPYLVFSMFYALWLWFTGKEWAQRRSRPENKDLPGSERGKQKYTPGHSFEPSLPGWGFGILMFVFLFFFFLTQSRGAFLGLAAAVAVFLVYTLFSRDEKLRKFGAIALVVLGIVGTLLFSFRDAGFVKSLPGSRLLELNLRADTAQTRFWTWGSALQGFKERPLLGWGPENFSAVFDKYFDPRHFIPGQNTQTWFDRAHSIFFDYLTETGVLGLTAFLGMWAAFFRFWFLGSRDLHPVLRGLLLALPVGYLVQGMILFDVLPIYMNIFIFLAFAGYLDKLKTEN